jgi:hypothetical protein
VKQADNHEAEEAGDRWVIWSEKHRMWRGPDGRGYTNSLIEAGRYTKQKALTLICSAHAGIGDEIAMPFPHRVLGYMGV